MKAEYGGGAYGVADVARSEFFLGSSSRFSVENLRQQNFQNGLSPG
jgi:hypothetical protein